MWKRNSPSDELPGGERYIKKQYNYVVVDRRQVLLGHYRFPLFIHVIVLVTLNLSNLLNCQLKFVIPFSSHKITSNTIAVHLDLELQKGERDEVLVLCPIPARILSRSTSPR